MTAIAETLNIATYSARKNSANLSDEYSVWNPPTSSPSPSGRSKGARLVSATIATTNSRKLGSSGIASQSPSCASTIREVDIEPV